MYYPHIHSHQERSTPSLKSIISFAFVLGFVHEEEFVILVIAASQSIDPIILILAYAISVAAVLIGVTVISLKIYQHIQLRVIQYGKYLPMISALFLIFMSSFLRLSLRYTKTQPSPIPSPFRLPMRPQAAISRQLKL